MQSGNEVRTQLGCKCKKYIQHDIRVSAKNIVIFAVLFVFACFLEKGYAVFRIDAPLSIGFLMALLFFFMIQKIRGALSYPKQIIWFLLWILFTLMVSLTVAPLWIGYVPKLTRIAYEFVCFIMMIIYLVFGYNIEKMGYGKVLFRLVAYITLLNALLAVFTEVFDIEYFRKIFYLSGAGIRFQGITGNPNDYMPLALFGIAYFGKGNERRILKYIGIAIISFSVIAAGSKGGLLTLIIYFSICIFENAIVYRLKSSQILLVLLAITTLIFGGIIVFYSENLVGFMHILSERIPGMERIVYFIYHPVEALNEGGSDRLLCWIGAGLLIKASPIVGVGIGGSARILETINYEYSYLTPHSAYLELLSQCGLIMGTIIILIFIRFLFKTLHSKEDKESNILRHTFYLYAINGIYFAVNWFTPFWVFLGILLYKNNNKYNIKRKAVIDEKRT